MLNAMGQLKGVWVSLAYTRAFGTLGPKFKSWYAHHHSGAVTLWTHTMWYPNWVLTKDVGTDSGGVVQTASSKDCTICPSRNSPRSPPLRAELQVECFFARRLNLRNGRFAVWISSSRVKAWGFDLTKIWRAWAVLGWRRRSNRLISSPLPAHHHGPPVKEVCGGPTRDGHDRSRPSCRRQRCPCEPTRDVCRQRKVRHPRCTVWDEPLEVAAMVLNRHHPANTEKESTLDDA